MNLPNLLTVSRLVVSPVFYLSLMIPLWAPVPKLPFFIAAVVLFLYIEITDILDGWLARSRNMVTELGKVLDPFSDVLSRLTYFVVFISWDIMPSWIFLLIMYRELAMTFLRMILFNRGIALAARRGGKLKAVLYAIAGGAGIILLGFKVFNAEILYLNVGNWIVLGFFLLALLASWASFVDYIIVFVKKMKELGGFEA